jgi:16S rRNA G966 N2-methylase RsmD
MARNGFNPDRILELGCGCSSYIMRWMWIKSEIVVIDDHKVWMRMLDEMGGHFKIDKKIFEETKEGFIKQISSNGKFDFIFIDSGHTYNDSGIWRVDFLKFIRENDVLNRGGIVMLHDANRVEYHEECRKWNHRSYFELYDTCLLSKWKFGDYVW